MYFSIKKPFFFDLFLLFFVISLLNLFIAFSPLFLPIKLFYEGIYFLYFFLILKKTNQKIFVDLINGVFFFSAKKIYFMSDIKYIRKKKFGFTFSYVIKFKNGKKKVLRDDYINQRLLLFFLSKKIESLGGVFVDKYETVQNPD